MSWYAWLAVAVALALSAVLLLRVLGRMSRADITRRYVRELDVALIDPAHPVALSTRYDVQELQGLPPPVQRYFRTVLTDGQSLIDTATIEMAGTINLSATAERWKSFISHQRVTTRRPGFMWSATVAMFPGVSAHVMDSYIAGGGRLVVKLLHLFTVAQAHGSAELARGEFMRWCADAAWYSSALLPSQGVRWSAVGEDTANATFIDGPNGLTLLFRFDRDARIASVHAESRGAGVGANMVMLPWDCRYFEYRRCDGMHIPMKGEAAWIRPEGRKAYFVGHVKKLAYNFLS